jgi:DNA-binding CsgD family transcriptional regulator
VAGDAVGTLPQDRLLDFVGDLYSAAEDASHWPDTLERLAVALGAAAASLTVSAPGVAPFRFAPDGETRPMRVGASRWSATLILDGGRLGGDQERLLQVLEPHIQRAVRLSLRLQAAEAPDDNMAGVEEAPDALPAQWRRRYGLTSAEAAFAAEIVKGDGKHAAAGRRGVTYATGRTHLTRIFQKTGARRQAELVRLLLLDTGRPGSDADG